MIRKICTFSGGRTGRESWRRLNSANPLNKNILLHPTLSIAEINPPPKPTFAHLLTPKQYVFANSSSHQTVNPSETSFQAKPYVEVKTPNPLPVKPKTPTPVLKTPKPKPKTPPPPPKPQTPADKSRNRMKALFLGASVIGALSGLLMFYKDIKKWVFQPEDKLVLLKDLRERVDVMGRKVDVLNENMEIVEKKVEVVDNKVDVVKESVDIVEKRVEGVEKKMDDGFDSLKGKSNKKGADS